MVNGKVDREDVCYGALSAIQIFPGVNENLGIVGFIIGLLYIFNACLSMYWIQYNKEKAMHGNEGAAKHVIFPAYVPFMWASTIVDIFSALIVFFVQFNLFGDNNHMSAVFIALMMSAHHFVIEGVSFLLLQYGVGLQGTRRAFRRAMAWAIVTFVAYIIVIILDSSTGVATIFALWQILLFLFYAVVWLVPEKKLFRRNALISYSRFWTIFRAAAFIAAILLFEMRSGASSCFFFFGPLLVYTLSKPYVVYRALLADSAWWQHAPVTVTRSTGFGKHKSKDSSTRASMQESLHGPLQGLEVGFSEAQELAREVENIGNQGRVKLLNFAYLSLDKNGMLGAGSFSKVFKGTYRGTPVAIKLLYTLDLNPELIKRCTKEAQILSDVRHPNVVEIFGVSVLPPSVCIVLEICQFGSLSEVIRGSNGGSIVKRPLPLSFADRMYLAYGCAKGLEALHAYSSTICHRDIKSLNFLVDSQLNAKIADLELGGDEVVLEENGRLSVISEEDLAESASPVSPTSYKKLKNDDIQSTWMPPEIMRGKTYTQSSDIYSFGLVLWEIISGDIPFKSYRKAIDIRSHVLAGERPPMPPNVPDFRYVNCITQCWQDDPKLRPNIFMVVNNLRECWEGTVHRHIFSTSNTIDVTPIKEFYESENRRMEYQLRLTKGSFGSFSVSPMSRQGSMSRTGISPAASDALQPMRNDPIWTELDSTDNAYVVVTGEPPFLTLWIGKKWPMMTGYFASDLIARDLELLTGPKTDKMAYRSVVADAAIGKSSHAMVTMYRRDGSAFLNSLHAFPVFEKCKEGSETCFAASNRPSFSIPPSLSRNASNAATLPNTPVFCKSVDSASREPVGNPIPMPIPTSTNQNLNNGGEVTSPLVDLETSPEGDCPDFKSVSSVSHDEGTGIRLSFSSRAPYVRPTDGVTNETKEFIDEEGDDMVDGIMPNGLDEEIDIKTLFNGYYEQSPHRFHMKVAYIVLHFNLIQDLRM